MIFRKQNKEERAEEDPTGLLQAVRDFNAHDGPARIFYDRIPRAFETVCYDPGTDRYWPVGMCDGPDRAELYRKTSAAGRVTVTREELLMMEHELQPYSAWSR